MRNFGHVQHAAAEERYLAAILGRQVQNLLQPVNGTAEAGNYQAPLAPAEQILEARTNGSLALLISGPVDVRRIRQQQQHATLAVFS